MAARGLTFREIFLGVAAGAVAAGGAALILNDSDDTHQQIVVAAAPQNYEVAPFTEISTSGPQDLVITYGETQAIRAEGSPQALAGLEAVVIDGELTIRPKGFPAVANWGRFRSATFHITLPRLERLALAGSGDVTVDRIEGDAFEGTVAGSGKLSIASLRVDEADFSIGGSGEIDAAGTAREADVSIGGSGTIEADGLRIQNASVSIAGAGDVELTVEEEARISILGSGNVEINGSATCSVSRMGSGSVSCNGEEQ
jgi:hypothetical protein